MIKIKWTMVILKNKEKVKDLLNFKVMEADVNLRDAKCIEEFT